MDKGKLKKILAREGLILLPYALFVFFQRWTADSSIYAVLNPEAYEFDKKVDLVLYSTYPLYLLIRFIIWAIKTLRIKDH